MSNKIVSTAKKVSIPSAKRRAAANKPADDASDKDTKVKGFIYVVFVDTYITDTEILPKGIYKSDVKIDRLEVSAPKYVKKFVGSIPDKTLHEIAAFLKVSVTDESGNYRDSKDLLDEMTSVL